MERARIEAALADQLAGAKELHAVSTKLFHAVGEESFSATLIEGMKTIMRSDAASMQVYDPEEKALKLVAWTGFDPLSAERWQRIDASSITSCGEALAARERVIITDVEACDTLVGSSDLTEYRRSKLRAMQSTPLISRDGRLLGMISTHWRKVHTPSEDQLQRFDVLARQAADAIERTRADEALRKSEEKYSGLFAASPAPFLILKPDAPHFTIVEVNDAYLAATMRTRDDLVGRGVFEAFPDNPDDASIAGVRTLRASFEHVIASKQPETLPGLKYDIARPDGAFEERWWSPVNSPVLGKNGEVVAIIHNANDVTMEYRAEEALLRSERHAQTLLAELQHRVRNTLAIVRSIARRTAENSRETEDMLAHFLGRLDAFSRVQAALTRNAGGRVDLAALIEDELVAHAARDGEQVTISGPDVSLDSKTAERMSLAFHELATNAVKHGALINDKGHISISWSTEQDDGEGRGALVFDWREQQPVNGGATLERAGFGMELLRRSLPYDLQAETNVELLPEGLRFQLRMPLPEPASA